MEKSSLINTLTGSTSGDKETAVRLHSIIKNHPWFGLPYYGLLALDEFPAGSEKDSITGKALLHFAHPFLLHYQLTKQGLDEITEPAEDNKIQQPVNTEDNAASLAKHDHGEETVDEKIDDNGGTPASGEAETMESPAGSSPAMNSEETNTNGKADNELLFEPLYTTDYFASQGIKLSEQVISQDKLGRQMKSFTEWLKSMKKVNQEAGEAVNDKSESQVQVLAEKSNQETDVITESMAEVFIEQGQIEKARSIYEKLSLLNPSKSAYFAAKSEKLSRTG